MSVEQLPASVREFANYLNGLMARLDQGGGWCGVFWQRDPDGMQACLDGREVPPWDVVEALLHDLAAGYGPGGADPETERARALHTAALTAYDARPGARDALSDRLDIMLREQRYAAERQAELGHALASATTREQADAIRLDLAWARDDHERATARCAELRSRMADLDRSTASGQAAAIRRGRVGAGGVFRIDDGFDADGMPLDGARAGGASSGGFGAGGVSAGGPRSVAGASGGSGVGGVSADGFGAGGVSAGGPQSAAGASGGSGVDGVSAGASRAGAPWPDEPAAHGGAHLSMPHQRDARTAAEAPGRQDGRGAASDAGAGAQEGQRRAYRAEPADWSGGQPEGAGTADWPEEHQAAGRYTAGRGDTSDWPDPQQGAATDARFAGPFRHPDGSPGAPDARTAGRHDSGQGQPHGPYAAQGSHSVPDRDGTQRASDAGGEGRREVRRRPVYPYAPGAAAGAASDRPGRRQAGGATAPHDEGRRTHPYAGPGASGSSDRPDAQADGATAPHDEGRRTHPYAGPGASGSSDRPDPQHGVTAGGAPSDRRAAGWAAREDAAVDGGPGERSAPVAPESASAAEPAPKQRKRRRGSARFAGMTEEEAAPVVVPPTAVPAQPAPAATPRRTPRGARFAGAAAAERPVERSEPRRQALDPADRREVVESVQTLVRLRGEGRSGEAHALLVEATYWAAPRFPLLAAELERAGLGADWATLLWEAASLPADRLVAAADALAAAGRTADGEQILRQGVVRPAEEIGQAVLALAGEGRGREVRALLDAYVRVRTPEEAARSAAPGPQTLVPLLLEAAQGVSDERHWDLVHALRVAGFTT